MVIKSIQRELLNAFKADVATEFSVRVSPEGEENETYLLVGSQPQLVANISLLMAIRQLIKAEGFAKVVGEPWEQFVLKRPSPGVGIQFHWRLVQEPIWEPQDLAKKLGLNRRGLPRPQCYVQNVDADGLTFQKLFDAAGGKDGYMYGRFYAHAKMIEADLTTASSWNLTVYGVNHETALKQLKRMASLSKSKIGTLTLGEESNEEGRRKEDKQFQKPNVRIYPAWFFVNNYELVRAAMGARDPSTGEPVDYDSPQGRSTSLGKQFKKADAFYFNKGEPSRDDIERLKEVLKPPRRDPS